MPTRKKRIVEIQLDGYGRRYKFYPKTEDRIKHALKKMQEKTGAKTDEELYICKCAFRAAGIERAQESNSTNVTARHVIDGYNQKFRLTMEHALYKCMARSVLKRKAELRARSAVLDTLLNRVDE